MLNSLTFGRTGPLLSGVLCIVGIISGFSQTEYPDHVLRKNVKAVVKEKASQKISQEWAVYSDSSMEYVKGRLVKGDSVEIGGWGLLGFFIESKKVLGYISLKALSGGHQVDSMSTAIEEQSKLREELKKFNMRPVRALQVDLVPYQASSWFVLWSDKKSIVEGECAVVDLSFYVLDKNLVRLQFVNLGQQLAKIIPALDPGHSWLINENINDIKSETVNIGDKTVFKYAIYRSAYCPNRTGEISFPEVKLNMLRLKPKPSTDADTIVYKTQPVRIKVAPLPPNVYPEKSPGYKMVGSFTLSDSIRYKGPGLPYEYRVTLQGNGLTYPLLPPVISVKGVKAQLVDVEDTESLVLERVVSQKEFVYALNFEQDGTYDFAGKISFSFYDPFSNKPGRVATQSKVEAKVQKSIALSSGFYLMNNFIAIDASQSMMLEDYSPNRLGAATAGLRKFLSARKVCDVGLITFGSVAKHYQVSDNDSCYSAKKISEMGFMQWRGTAIGNAIYLAINSYKNSSEPKKLVIIGDGDNTAGNLSAGMAAEMARRQGIKIFAIGIGNKGRVPFGKDINGLPNVVENTFDENSFKEITTLTQGKYYHAKDAEDVARILKLIFNSFHPFK